MIGDDWQPGDLALCVRYNPDTGLLWWKARPPETFTTDGARKSWNSKHAGLPAFSKRDRHGYLCGKFKRRDLKAHRVAWLLYYGRPPEGVIDHINGDPADNRIANLRAVTQRENLRNSRLHSGSKSGVTGVRPSGSKWQAEIWNGTRRVHLGTFATKEAAARARRAAEVAHGFHPNHGRPHTPDAEDAETIRLLNGKPVKQPA
jgi:hypothetical protein